MDSSYTKFSPYIDKEIKIIVECGSRDCLGAIEMLKVYDPEIIYSFECNPECIETCKENIQNYSKIELIDKAVSDKNGEITFYATGMQKSLDKNIGASSALIHKGGQKTFVQKEIIVPSITLDTFFNENNLDKIDLLCLDLQGYEKIALTGFLKNVEKVSYIISEVSFEDYYYNNVLFDEYVKFLEDLNFTMITVDPIQHFLQRRAFGDALFINEKAT